MVLVCVQCVNGLFSRIFVNWWAYHDCRMMSYTPYYIILGEFGSAILLAILAKRFLLGN